MRVTEEDVFVSRVWWDMSPRVPKVHFCEQCSPRPLEDIALHLTPRQRAKLGDMRR